jgi:hypothetical protein
VHVRKTSFGRADRPPPGSQPLGADSSLPIQEFPPFLRPGRPPRYVIDECPIVRFLWGEGLAPPGHRVLPQSYPSNPGAHPSSLRAGLSFAEGAPPFCFQRVGLSFPSLHCHRKIPVLPRSNDYTEKYPLTDQLSHAILPREIDLPSRSPRPFSVRPKSALYPRPPSRWNFRHSLALLCASKFPNLPIHMDLRDPRPNYRGYIAKHGWTRPSMLQFFSPPCLAASTLP